MECSTDPWFSEPEMMNQSSEILMESVNNNDQIFADDFMGTFDDLLGEDFVNSMNNNTYDFTNNIVSAEGFISTAAAPLIDPISFINQSNPEPQLIDTEAPLKWKIGADRAPIMAPIILNFGEANADNDHVEMVNREEVKNGTQAANKNNRDRPQSQTYDHIVSERKRRKLLSEQFLTLSGMVPGLKKMDKTSVLGATIKHMRNLQEHAEMVAKEKVESVVLVRKSQIMIDKENDDAGSSNENNNALPEIEAKVCNNQALLKVHCEKQKGLMAKIIIEVDKLNMNVVQINVSSLGNFLDITIFVEMDKEHTVLANQIVQALHYAFIMPAS